MLKQKISLIAAMSENRVIGRNNELPWKMPADWDNFKRITKDKPFIMGRKSYEAPDKLLSTKKSIILTHQHVDDLCDNCQPAESLSSALNFLKDEPEIFILGGQNVFEQSIPMADYLYLTIIHAHVDGDAFFPKIDKDEWEIVKNEFHRKDELNPYDYTFRELKRERPI